MGIVWAARAVAVRRAVQTCLSARLALMVMWVLIETAMASYRAKLLATGVMMLMLEMDADAVADAVAEDTVEKVAHGYCLCCCCCCCRSLGHRHYQRGRVSTFSCSSTAYRSLASHSVDTAFAAVDVALAVAAADSDGIRRPYRPSRCYNSPLQIWPWPTWRVLLQRRRPHAPP